MSMNVTKKISTISAKQSFYFPEPTSISTDRDSLQLKTDITKAKREEDLTNLVETDTKEQEHTYKIDK